MMQFVFNKLFQGTYLKKLIQLMSGFMDGAKFIHVGKP